MSADAVMARVLDEMIEAAETQAAESQRRFEADSRYAAALRDKRRAVGESAENNGPASPIRPIKRPTSNGQKHLKPPIPGLVERVISDAKGPLTLTEITERVAALGASTDSPKGLVAQISSSLYRYSDKYERVAPSTYDLKERVQHKKTTASG